DPAMRTGGPVSPNYNQMYLMAFVLGLVIPIGFVYLKDLLNYKVQSTRDVEEFSSIPILGELVRSHEKQVLVVNRTTRTEVSELFRLIRSNLQFAVTDKTDNKVLMVTSSMTGEGKTFFTINLAASLAITGK